MTDVVVAYSIDRQTFEKVLGKISSLMQRANDSRMLAGVPLLKPANLSPPQYAALAQAMRHEKNCHAASQLVTKGESVKPALFFVRGGRVKVEQGSKTSKSKKNDTTTEVVSAGGYFGESLIVAGVSKGKRKIKSKMTATCTEAATVSELRLADMRDIFNVDRLLEKESPTEQDDPAKEDEEEDTLRQSSFSASMLAEDWGRPIWREDIKLDDLEKTKMLGAGTFGQGTSFWWT